MSTNLTLTAEKFSDFLRCVTNLKEECNDIDIKNGVIRQRSNDKTSIFQIDMTPILSEEVSMSISDIKKKLDLFKMFAGNEVNLEINEEDNGYFIFSDAFISLKFMTPAYQFIDNKYMTEDDLQAIFNLNEDDLILEYELSSILTERIRIITTSFNIKAIQVEFDGETATIKAGTQAKDQFANVAENITTNVVFDRCSANLGVIPFSIEHDDNVSFKMYKDANQDISLNTFTTKLGDNEMVIFTRSSLVQDEE
jgi:hypothetical protein